MDLSNHISELDKLWQKLYKQEKIDAYDIKHLSAVIGQLRSFNESQIQTGDKVSVLINVNTFVDQQIRATTINQAKSDSHFTFRKAVVTSISPSGKIIEVAFNSDTKSMDLTLRKE